MQQVNKSPGYNARVVLHRSNNLLVVCGEQRIGNCHRGVPGITNDGTVVVSMSHGYV